MAINNKKIINNKTIKNENIINNDINNKEKEKLSPENTQLIRDITTQISALFGADNFLMLFPRLDFKGFGYVPQFFL